MSQNARVATRVTSDAFVGRAAELAELEQLLGSARSGRAQLVFVGGESGVGKSRLADELADRARKAGDRVLWGDCVELGDGELPYGAIVSALRPLARAEDPIFSELGQVRPELARLLPELGAPGDLNVEPYSGTGRARMFELLLGLLERLGRSTPVVLVLEDLHWADRSTRELIAFLSRNLCKERVLLIGTYRSDELHRRHPLRPLLAELERAERVHRVALIRFSRDELRQQLHGILGAEPDAALLDRLWRRSEGNALFAEELLAAGSDGAGELPESLRDALMLRVEALPETVQDVLRWIAAGTRVSHETLLEISGLEAADLRPALRTAIAHHVLVSHQDGTYGFRHALLREAVYDDLLPGERGDLHHKLGEALDASLFGEVCVPLDVAGAVAHHFDAAGDQPRALETAVRAADAAQRVFANGVAAKHFERALQLWDRVPDAEERIGLDHVDLLQRAGEIHPDPMRAAEMFKRALTEIGELESDPLRAAGLLQRLGKARWNAGKGQSTMDAYDEALRLLAGRPPSEALAMLLASKAATLMLWGRVRDADLLCEAALEVADAVGSRLARMHVLNTRAVCRQALGDTDAAIAEAREGLAMAGADDRLDQLVRAYLNLSDVLHTAGRSHEALAVLAEALERMDARGYKATWLSLQRSEIAFAVGDWVQADRMAPLDQAPRHEGTTRILYELRRAELELGRGEHAAARARLEWLRDRAAHTLEPQWVAPIAALLVTLYRRERDLPAARSAIDWGLERLQVHGGPSEDAPRLVRVLAAAAGVEAEVAQAARDLGRPGDEAEAATRAADYAARAVVAAGTLAARTAPEAAIAAAVAEAEAAIAGARAPEPERWAAVAAACDELNRPYRAASYRLREAECRLATGDRAGAALAVRRAHEAAVDLGARRLAEELEQLARRGRLRLDDGGTGEEQETTPAAAAAADPAQELGLTPRERDVLVLLARGRTNREIGESLYMAEKTASVHVSRILAKLGVRSRTEAAAVATRLGLADEPAGAGR
jgi:ATP/maltotriose-dependent transcriptional regulator MalT